MSHKSRMLPGIGRSLRAAAFRSVLAFGAIALFTPAALAQTTVYVDNQSAACSLTGPGTEASPFCTITSAMTAFKGAGITIVVKPGIYREQVTIPASGGAGSPFVFQARGPGVIVDGADDFANPALWLPTTSASFLAAGVTWAPKQVYVDGVRLAISALTPDLMPANSFSWVAGSGLYVNLGGVNPGSRQTLVGHRNYGFNMFTKAFVTIDGFSVTRTEDRGINIQNGCADLTIAHNTVSFANSYGIQTVNGQRLVIDGNTVSDCNFHGIGLNAGASGCTVSDNEAFRNAHPTIRQANGIFLFGAPGNAITNNRLHENQDTGLQFGLGSNDCVSTNNRSYRNGDHGYDHLGALNTTHLNDVAYGNLMDGFSFEGNSPGSKLYNCIASENGTTTGEFDLWVDATSTAGFVSDHNIFWNSTAQAPVKYILTLYSALADFQLATGLDMHSFQADPLFTDVSAANFTPLALSPAIDAAHSGVALWPVLDALGHVRVDDPSIADRGEGPVTYADIGAFEFLPPPPPPSVDKAPVVTSPGTVRVRRGGLAQFKVTAMDPDGDAIQSLRMVILKMPLHSGATFTPDPGNQSGTFRWVAGRRTGTYRVMFIAQNALADTSVTRIHVGDGGRDDGELAAGEADEDDLVQLGEDGLFTPELALSAGFPNPSASDIEFLLDLNVASQVDLSVFDMQGRRVWTAGCAYSAGRVRLHWDGMTARRQRAGVGIYHVLVRVGDKQFVRRAVRL